MKVTLIVFYSTSSLPYRSIDNRLELAVWVDCRRVPAAVTALLYLLDCSKGDAAQKRMTTQIWMLLRAPQSIFVVIATAASPEAETVQKEATCRAVTPKLTNANVAFR